MSRTISQEAFLERIVDVNDSEIEWYSRNFGDLDQYRTKLPASLKRLTDDMAEMVNGSWKQTRQPLPKILEELVKLPYGRRQARSVVPVLTTAVQKLESALQSDLNDAERKELEQRLHNVKWTLEKANDKLTAPVGLTIEESEIRLKNQIGSFWQSRFSAQDLLLLSTHLPMFDAYLRQKGLVTDDMLLEMPRIDAEELVDAHEGDALMGHILRLAYNQPNAVVDFIRMLPRFAGTEHPYFRGSTVGLDVRKATAVAQQWPGTPLSEQDVTPFIQSLFDHEVHAKALYPSHTLRRFYWEQMPADKWMAVAGYINTFRRRSNFYWWQGSRDTFRQVIHGQLFRILNRVGAADVLVTAKRDDIVKRLEIPSSNVSLTSEDPYSLKAVAQIRHLYEYTSVLIKARMADMRLPEFDKILGEPSMHSKIRPMEWVVTEFSKPEYHGLYRSPLFARAQEILGNGTFFHTAYDKKVTDIACFVGLLPSLIELQKKLPADQFDALFVDILKNNLSLDDAKFHLEMFSHPRTWSRFSDDHKKRKMLTSIGTSNSREDYDYHHRLVKVIAEKEKSRLVLEAFDSHNVWNKLESLDLFKLIEKGLYYTTRSTYRAVRPLFIEPELITFLNAAMSHANDSMNHSILQKNSNYQYAACETYEAILAGRPVSHEVAVHRTLNELAAKKKALHEQFGVPMQRGCYDPQFPPQILLQYERLKEKEMQIICTKANSVLTQFMTHAYTYAIKDITGISVSEPTLEQKNLVAICMTMNEREKVREAAEDLLTHAVKGNVYDVSSLGQNAAFVCELSSKGICMDPWLNGFCASYSAGYQTREQLMQDIERFGTNIESILLGLDVIGVPYAHAVEAARQKGASAAVLDDLSIQVRQYVQLMNKAESKSKYAQINVPIKIHIETDPYKIALMGAVVDGSCLSIAGGNAYSAIVNSLDLSKRVLYATCDGKIVGRKLIALTQDNQIAQFATYNKGRLFLDDAFEQFIQSLSVASGLPLYRPKVDTKPTFKSLVFEPEMWYYDGVKSFRHLPEAGN
ncbi:MAG TPA: hypothetical protein VK158_04305 [Acidobacteriota bacterium]|nr:hypothetical protein [Acidobacteriota bacterium]